MSKYLKWSFQKPPIPKYCICVYISSSSVKGYQILYKHWSLQIIFITYPQGLLIFLNLFRNTHSLSTVAFRSKKVGMGDCKATVPLVRKKFNKRRQFICLTIWMYYWNMFTLSGPNITKFKVNKILDTFSTINIIKQTSHKQITSLLTYWLHFVSIWYLMHFSSPSSMNYIAKEVVLLSFMHVEKLRCRSLLQDTASLVKLFQRGCPPSLNNENNSNVPPVPVHGWVGGILAAFKPVVTSPLPNARQ